MIIIGYQGIGKSTISGYTTSMIDLESGNFWVDGKRNDNWYKVYVNIAEHLSNQGYIVFLSSHKVVREELNRREVPFAVICPSLEIKEKWIDKLKSRYEHSMSEKDFKAWKNAEQCYDENIKDLMSEKICCTIDSANYYLGDFVVKADHELYKKGSGDDSRALPDTQQAGFCDGESVNYCRHNERLHQNEHLEDDVDSKDWVQVWL